MALLESLCSDCLSLNSYSSQEEAVLVTDKTYQVGIGGKWAELKVASPFNGKREREIATARV
jgi:hypothetical protein